MRSSNGSSFNISFLNYFKAEVEEYTLERVEVKKPSEMVAKLAFDQWAWSKVAFQQAEKDVERMSSILTDT